MKTQLIKKLAISIALLLITSCASKEPKPDPCLHKYAAFDIGSGTTKMKVAELNTCNHTILRIIKESARPVSYAENLEKSKSQTFSDQMIKTALKEMTAFKKEAQDLGAEKMSGVATASFRKARNSDFVTQKFQQELSIPVKVISQKEEALLGFKSAVLATKIPLHDLIVWDIGGGSQQMTTFNEQIGELEVYESTNASVTFKNILIDEILKKHSEKTKSPNPIQTKNLPKAIQLAKELAVDVPINIKQKVARVKVVYGIGGVHYHSAQGQVNRAAHSYTQEELNKTLKKRANLSDAQLNSKYAATDVSNLILLLGYMKALKIEKVNTLNIDLTDGVLLQSAY